MTKVRFHGPIAGFSGAMGEMVFADQEKKGRTLAYMKKHYEPTQAQLNHREHFKEAVRHAQVALEDPAMLAFYEMIAEQRDSNAYAVAVTDYLVAPSFKSLDLSQYKGQVGDPIVIRAVDDIGLAEVEVTLSANNGTQIEKGKALEDRVHAGYWTYIATAPVAFGSEIFIEVKGMDHAGTKAQHTESPRVGVDE
jgi:hypothetical protein